MRTGVLLTLVLALVAVYLGWSLVIFPRDCRAAGGDVVTYPHRETPQCWNSATGRRVFP